VQDDRRRVAKFELGAAATATPAADSRTRRRVLQVEARAEAAAVPVITMARTLRSRSASRRRFDSCWSMGPEMALSRSGRLRVGSRHMAVDGVQDLVVGAHGVILSSRSRRRSMAAACGPPPEQVLAVDQLDGRHAASSGTCFSPNA